MDASAVVLNKLLTERDIDIWGRLKLAYLDPAFSSLYSAIHRYYTRYNTLPSFEDLDLVVREGPVQATITAVQAVDASEITAEVAIDALIDQYTQNETIKLLTGFVEKLPVYSTEEIKQGLADLSLQLDDKTLASDKVFGMNDMRVFKSKEEVSHITVYTGLSNHFDSEVGGMRREETLYIGGKRGSGKSIVCSNIVINQYEMGYTSAYFTIEMTASETLDRFVAIGAGVNHQHVKQGTLTDEELLKVVRWRAGMFKDSEHLVDEFIKTRDKYKFEESLVKECELKDNQIIIIDDRELTLGAIDMHLTKIKAKHGDKLACAVIDYVNQINVGESKSQYEWAPQIEVSKGLKNLARKHNILLVSPYQIDNMGEARFAKGILDSADVAMLLDAHDKEDGAISFETTKIRGASGFKTTSPINWETLAISPNNIEAPAAKSETKSNKKPSNKQSAVAVPDAAADLPWDA